MRVEFDKALISRIDQLLQSCQEGNGQIKAIKMLDYLLDYTEFHFDAEEKLQEEISFPAINEHKAKHGEFKNAVKELQEMLEEEEGPTEAFVAQVQKNVVDWLFDHIKIFDRAVAEYKG